MYFSELEQMIMADMFELGFNPSSQDEIQKYWECIYGY